VAILQAVLFAAASLIALTNPVAEIPLFLSLVQSRTPKDMHAAAITVGVGVWIILAVAAVAGLRILGVFGIQLSAFRAAGGLLLVVMGLEMIQGREPESASSKRDAEDREDALWVPLVMPLLAGPGAIVITMTLAVRDSYLIAGIPVATLLAITLAALAVYLVLALAVFIRDHLGSRGTRILTRFSGLILVAIGFQMGFTGIAEFFGV
jgi:multiple antibiotic resistance protein